MPGFDPKILAPDNSPLKGPINANTPPVRLPAISSTLGGDALSTISVGVDKAASAAGDVVAAGAVEASKIVDEVADIAKFYIQYNLNQCFRISVNRIYASILDARTRDEQDGWFEKLRDSFLQEDSAYIKKNLDSRYLPIQVAPYVVHRDRLAQAQKSLAACLSKERAKKTSEETKPALNFANVDPGTRIKPFDRRMDRLLAYEGNFSQRTPFDTNIQQASTTGFTESDESIMARDLAMADKSKINWAEIAKNKDAMRKDDFYIGLPSLINPYSITKLYGSKGGEYLLDQKGKRAWYEVDDTQNSQLSFSKNPTTTSIISWGNQDLYGRTPYHFTDFAFCKYWNLIPNNRLITLRRFAAPIYDNMKFPGMDGINVKPPPKPDGENNTETIGANGVVQKEGTETKPKQGNEEAEGSTKKIDFPPMATALTYFGEETGNTLNGLLKFTTGLKWGEAKAGLWDVKPSETVDVDSGPGGIGNLGKYAKMFNIATGNFDQKAILNGGQHPPDPYENGPYENRVIGPMNRIEVVKKREAGLEFEHKLSIIFEYVGRPVGGVNTKAALLDILSNFLIIGSATAMFWGGQHRFMGQPQKYPFIGGEKGMQQWYSGNPIGWGETTIASAAEEAPNLASMGFDFLKDILGVFSGGNVLENVKNVASGKGIGANIIKAKAAEASKGQIPFLTGMKALLIGEPVGEWHVTIGNPLNPIAMIGNLICNNIVIEFNEELGPDDFPTELKITVSLEHGMARDKDSIQSIFNRGMGRIYELPDDFQGSADAETSVDKYTQNIKGSPKYSPAGRNPDWMNVPIGGGPSTTYGKFGRSAVQPLANGNNVSVWNRPAFNAISGTQTLDLSYGKVEHKSQFRAADWVMLKSLK